MMKGLSYDFLIVTGAVTFIVSLCLMHSAVRVFNIRQLTIPGFFYSAYTLILFFPSFYVAFDKPELYRNTYLIAVTSVMLTYPVGVGIANLVMRFHPVEIRRYFRTRIANKGPEIHDKVVFALLLAGSLGFVLLYLVEVPRIPLLYAVQNPGEYQQLTILREEAFKLLNSRFIYIYNWLKEFIIPVMVALSLGFTLYTKSRSWLLMLVLTLAVGLLYNGATLARMPVVVIAMVTLLFTYMYYRGQLSVKFLVAAAVLVVAFPIFSVLIRQFSVGVGLLDAFEGLFRRIFYTPANALYYFFEVFPHEIGFLHGRSIGELAHLMGEPHFSTARYLYDYRHSGGLASGYSNAGFIGNFYADFGLPGVLIIGVMLGTAMQTIQIHLLRKKRTILRMAVYAFLMFTFARLTMSALPSAVWSKGILLALMLPWAWCIVESVLRAAVEGSARHTVTAADSSQ